MRKGAIGIERHRLWFNDLGPCGAQPGDGLGRLQMFTSKSDNANPQSVYAESVSQRSEGLPDSGYPGLLPRSGPEL